MTDEELIGYCELHCTTERALFHVDHLDRMLELAGRPDGYVKTCKDWVTKWYSVHEDEMLPLCNLARERMRSNVLMDGLGNLRKYERRTTEERMVAAKRPRK